MGKRRPRADRDFVGVGLFDPKRRYSCDVELWIGSVAVHCCGHKAVASLGEMNVCLRHLRMYYGDMRRALEKLK